MARPSAFLQSLDLEDDGIRVDACGVKFYELTRDEAVNVLSLFQALEYARERGVELRIRQLQTPRQQADAGA